MLGLIGEWRVYCLTGRRGLSVVPNWESDLPRPSAVESRGRSPAGSSTARTRSSASTRSTTCVVGLCPPHPFSRRASLRAATTTWAQARAPPSMIEDSTSTATRPRGELALAAETAALSGRVAGRAELFISSS